MSRKYRLWILLVGLMPIALGCGADRGEKMESPPEIESAPETTPAEQTIEGPTFPESTSTPNWHDRMHTLSASAGASATIASAHASYPESTSAEAADELSELDRKLAKLQLGSIAFNTPESIPYGDAATIELLASLKEAEAALREAVRGDGPVDSARVQLGDRMEARLTGTGFRIEAITPEMQALSQQQRTQWRWEIEPTRPDDLELHLTLSAIFRIEGESVTRTIQTFERTIFVDVPLAKRVQNFVAGNYQFVGSAIIVPVVGGLYHRHRKKRRASSAASSPRVERKAA